MDTTSPSRQTKWQRTKVLAETRRAAARLWVELRTSVPGTDAHQEALARCPDKLVEFLYTTASPQQIKELREEFPTLPDPELPEPAQPELFNFANRSLTAT